MEKISYIRQIETEDGMGDTMYLCYFVSCNEKEGEKSYGVGIDMYTQKYSERTGKERQAVNNIFRTKLEAELFAEMLFKGLVTPTTLSDIVEDHFKELA